jgi:hypothetical protein
LSHKVKMVAYVVLGILAVLVIERKTGIFTKVFSKVPGVNTLLG